MSNIFKKINKNIEENNCILTKQELEEMKNRCLELRDLIIDSTKKHDFLKAKKYSDEFSIIVKKLKNYEKKLKKN